MMNIPSQSSDVHIDTSEINFLDHAQENPKIDQAFPLTQAEQDPNYNKEVERIGMQPSNKQIYHIDSAYPPQFNDYDQYMEMPKQVEFLNLVSNILNSRQLKQNPNSESMQGTKQTTQGQFTKSIQRKSTKYERWRSALILEENKAVISDSFWFAICKYKIKKSKFQKFKEDKITSTQSHDSSDEDHYREIKKKLVSRIARNYVNLMLSVDEIEYEAFFKTYFDIVAQAVLYALFYAYPKSRREFNNELKRDLILWFSKKFTGVQIANSEKYWNKWNLYLLGEGNILQKQRIKQDQKETKQETLPELPIRKIPKQRNQRQTMDVRFSPIIENYIDKYKYKTRNTIQKFRMKFTQYNKNQEQVEKHFAQYQDIASEIKKKANELYQDNLDKKKEMNRQIRQWKQETIRHHKRLEKRKQEEQERGSREYSNYLVSMSNAGLNNANLGVTNQKGMY